jgi:D-alanine-D-alanine ligase
MEVLLHGDAEPDIYSYANKRNYHGRVSYRLAEEEMAQRAGSLALRVWTELGCRDAGRLDVRCDGSGIPNFLEINPLAGLHPVDSDMVVLCGLLGIGYDSLIGMIVGSALDRVPARGREGA